MDDKSPLREEHGKLAAEQFARWAQEEGILARISEEQCAELARAFMRGFAVGVGVGTAEGRLDVQSPPQLIERPGGIFEHTGMGICNKGRSHVGQCFFGNGV